MAKEKDNQKESSNEDLNSDRAKSGIPGFDDLLNGGIPRNNLVLLSGSCGTGKSTFAAQFLYNGATKYNEPGIYISLEEDPKRIMKDMSVYGWDMDAEVKKKRITFISPEVYKFEELRRLISDEIDKIGAKRIVVDSFTLLSTYFKSDYETRKALVQLDREMKKTGCTSLAISDIKEGSDSFSITGYEEFVVDGVIVLKYTSSDPNRLGSYVRSVFVRKMRGTSHSSDTVPMRFEKDGVRVYPSAKVF